MLRSFSKWRFRKYLPKPGTTVLVVPERTFTKDCKRTSICDLDHSPTQIYQQLSNDVRDIFKHAVDSVLPGTMVKNNLQICDNTLIVGQRDFTKEYRLTNNVHIVAFGKAVAGMVRAAEDVLGDHVHDGIASIPTNYINTFRAIGRDDLLPSDTSKIKLYEGAASNLPDAESHAASMKIMKLAKTLNENDIMLTLISGGGSSLLCTPRPPITMDELRAVSKLLSTHGSSITEMNTVRKQLELLKGGGLSRMASPAKVISLILSDVIGDPIDFIASGPTCVDYSTPRQCLDLFDQLEITPEVPTSVMEVLQDRHKQHIIKDPRPTSLAAYQALLTNSYNLVVGSNILATTSAAQRARECGYLPFVLSNTVDKDAQLVGTQYSRIARFICRSMGHKFGKDSTKLVQDELELVKAGISKAKVNELRTVAEMSVNTGKPVCVICGGETTVHVRGSGVGGRNQEMALACALNMHERIYANEELRRDYAILFLSAGSDGMDGPCDAAGAWVMPETITQATRQGLNSSEFLVDNDSYNFFKRLNNGDNHVVTGHTGTNVMDIQLLIIQPLLL